MTKAELYAAVAACRAQYFTAPTHNLLSIQHACQTRLGLTVESGCPFKTPGLRGVAFISSGLICLDAKLSPERRRFYCAHEAYHFIFHANHLQRYHCFDEGHPTQNDYLEWQANEAAAETLIPYHLLLLQLQAAAPHIHSGKHFHAFLKESAQHFGVTLTMVRTRLNSLKYEIVQLLAGTAIDNIRLLSDTQQAREGIHVKSLNQIYTDAHVQYPLAKLGLTLSA